MRGEVTVTDVRYLAKLLLRRTTDTAFLRLKQEAREQKQSVKEIAYRRASNILRSLALRQAV
jgi:hypothetical protein